MSELPLRRNEQRTKNAPSSGLRPASCSSPTSLVTRLDSGNRFRSCVMHSVASGTLGRSHAAMATCSYLGGEVSLVGRTAGGLLQEAGAAAHRSRTRSTARRRPRPACASAAARRDRTPRAAAAASPAGCAAAARRPAARRSAWPPPPSPAARARRPPSRSPAWLWLCCGGREVWRDVIAVCGGGGERRERRHRMRQTEVECVDESAAATRWRRETGSCCALVATGALGRAPSRRPRHQRNNYATRHRLRDGSWHHVWD